MAELAFIAKPDGQVTRMTGAFEHQDVGKVIIGRGTIDTYRITFTNRVGQICTVYRSAAWVREGLKKGWIKPWEEESGAVPDHDTQAG